jgi:hypothetical protein
MKTLSEKQVLRKFKTNKKKMIEILGVKSTLDSDLTDLGKKLFDSMYLGTFSQDNLPWSKIKKKNSIYAIINTDTSKGPGVHWVALAITPKTIYIWDSYGRNAERLLPKLTKQIKGKKIKIREADPDKDQSDSSEICGALCLAWLSCVKQLGIRNSLKI